MRQASLFPRLALIIVALLGAVVGLRGFSSAAESARSIPPPVLDEPADVGATSEVATLAGGCKRTYSMLRSSQRSSPAGVLSGRGLSSGFSDA